MPVARGWLGTKKRTPSLAECGILAQGLQAGIARRRFPIFQCPGWLRCRGRAAATERPWRCGGLPLRRQLLLSPVIEALHESLGCPAGGGSLTTGLVGRRASCYCGFGTPGCLRKHVSSGLCFWACQGCAQEPHIQFVAAKLLLKIHRMTNWEVDNSMAALPPVKTKIEKKACRRSCTCMS